MRFTEFLVEAPQVQQKPRGRMVNGKFVPNQQPRQRPQQVRGQGGRFAPNGNGLNPMEPRPQQTVQFQKQPGVKPIQPGNQPQPKKKPAQQKQQPNDPWQKMLQLSAT